MNNVTARAPSSLLHKRFTECRALDNAETRKYARLVMESGAPERDRTVPNPAPLWPYGALAATVVLLGGVLILEQRPLGWVMRFVDARLLLAYAAALRRRMVDADLPRDIGITTASALAAAAALTGILAAVGVLDVPVSAALGLVCRAYIILSVVKRVVRGGPTGGYEIQLHNLRPVHATVGSFALAILAGWALLTLPQATPVHEPPLLPLDGLFTATSATCVTGLIVKDTSTGFSLFGKLVIIGLIQLGGLGIMTFAALFDLVRRRGLSVRRRMIVGDLVTRGENHGIRGALRGLVLFALSAELVGATALWLRFRGTTGSAWGDVFLSVFHSVSAFCNAGFSLFSDSLEGYLADPAINIIISALVIVGGIGFPVVQAIWRRVRLKRQGLRHPLELHTKLVLVTSAWLLGIGFVSFLLLEWHGALVGLSAGERLWGAGFQSMTTRTAGFDTLAISKLGPATLLVFILLMAIGASPGSTGGGMKTTTAATLWLTARSMILGREHVPCFGREIPGEVRHRAVAVAALFGAGIIAGTLLLCASETITLQDALFEVTSAIGTVGLSTGVTAGLSRVGKAIIAALMFAGRVGPLSLALAIAKESKRRSVRYPEDHIMVG